MTRTAVLRGIAVAGVAAGGWSFVRPVSSGGAEPPVEELAPPATLPLATQSSDSLATDIVLANVFSADRRPPHRRYTPLDSAATVDAEPVTSEAGLALAAPTDLIPALYGTVVSGGVDQALLYLNAATSGPRLYPVGARDGGYRVVSIAPRVVVLAGPQGRVVLRLSPKAEEHP